MTKHVNNRVELLYGTLDLLILRTLLYGPSHGHAIAKHIQRVSENALQIETGISYGYTLGDGVQGSFSYPVFEASRWRRRR